MEIKATDLELVSINSLVPHPKNMHDHSDEQIERLCKILEYQGFRTPLTVQKGTNLIVCGHGRLMAAKKLGMEKVPVSYQEFDSEEQLYAHIVADNAIGKDSWAKLDLGKINLELENLGPDLDIDMLGLKDFVIEPIEKYDEEKQDEVPEVENPITKRGDIWILGNHRVMCGDSTMIDDVEKLMLKNNADITFTSPPYNAAKTVTEKKMNKESKYRNDSDNKSEDDYRNFLNDFTTICINKTKDTFVNIQSLSGNKIALIYYLYDLKEFYSDTIIWDKRLSQPAMPKNVLNSRFEYIHAFGKNNSRSLGSKDFRGTIDNVVNIDKQTKNKIKEHNATFPVELAEFFVENFSLDSVYEPFCGSGSTLIACEKTNRKCYGMELDEHYCDVIINRWQNFTGKEAVLESTGQKYNELKEITHGS